MSDEHWPALPYDEWKDTYATLHLWSQVVGKIALSQAPAINHSWGIALQLTARGLATRALPHGDRTFQIEFDFIDHALDIRTSDGDRRRLPLEPRAVAAFYSQVTRLLEQMALPVKIWPVAVEIPTPIRLDSDTEHRSYDAEYAQRFWRILLQIERLLTASR